MDHREVPHILSHSNPAREDLYRTLCGVNILCPISQEDMSFHDAWGDSTHYLEYSAALALFHEHLQKFVPNIQEVQ